MYRQQGFSLLEALVAFLILSIGLLGIASLQVLSLKAGKTAELRTIAVIKSEEILERIRVNAASVADYASDAGYQGQNFGCNDYTGAIKYCSGNEMAQDDIFNWKNSLKNSLPDNAGTTATIDVTPPVAGVNPTAVVVVTINWQERNPETKTMDNMNYRVSAQICTGC